MIILTPIYTCSICMIYSLFICDVEQLSFANFNPVKFLCVSRKEKKVPHKYQKASKTGRNKKDQKEVESLKNQVSDHGKWYPTHVTLQ